MKNELCSMLYSNTTREAYKVGLSFSPRTYLFILYRHLAVDPDHPHYLRKERETCVGDIDKDKRVVCVQMLSMLRVVTEDFQSRVSGTSTMRPQNLPHTSTSTTAKTDSSNQIPTAHGVQSSGTIESLHGFHEADELSNNVSGMNEQQDRPRPASYTRDQANQQNPESFSNNREDVYVHKNSQRLLSATNNLSARQTQINSTSSAGVTANSGVRRSPYHTSATLTTNTPTRKLEPSCHSAGTSALHTSNGKMEYRIHSSEEVCVPTFQPPRSGVNETHCNTHVESLRCPENDIDVGNFPTTINDQTQYGLQALISLRNLRNSQFTRLSDLSGTNVDRTQTNSTIIEPLNVPMNKGIVQSTNVSTDARQQDIRTSHSYLSQSQNHHVQNTSHSQTFQHNVNQTSNLVTRNPQYRPLPQQIPPTNRQSTSGYVVITGQQNMNRPTVPQTKMESRSALMAVHNTSNQLIPTNVGSSATPFSGTSTYHYHPSGSNNSSKGVRLQQTSDSNHSSSTAFPNMTLPVNRKPQQHLRRQMAFNNSISSNNPGLPHALYSNTPRTSLLQPVPTQVQTAYTTQMAGSQQTASRAPTLANTNSNMASIMHSTSQKCQQNQVPYNTTMDANNPRIPHNVYTNSPTSINFPISTQSAQVAKSQHKSPTDSSSATIFPNVISPIDRTSRQPHINQIPHNNAMGINNSVVSHSNSGSSNVIPTQRTGLTREHLAQLTHTGIFQQTSSIDQSAVPMVTFPVEIAHQQNRQNHESINNARDVPGINQTVQSLSGSSSCLKALLVSPAHSHISVRHLSEQPDVVESSQPQQHSSRNSVLVLNSTSGALSGANRTRDYLANRQRISTSFTQSPSQTSTSRVSEPTNHTPTSPTNSFQTGETHIIRELNPIFTKCAYARGNSNNSAHTELPSNLQINNTAYVQTVRENPVNLNVNLNYQTLNNRNLYNTSTMGNTQTSPRQLETSFVGNVRKSTYSNPSSQQHRVAYAAKPALSVNPTSSVIGAQETGEAYRTATDDAEVVSMLTRKDFHSSRQSLDSGVGLWSPTTSEPCAESPGNAAQTPVASHASPVSGGQELATVADGDDADSDGMDELQCVCCSNAAQVMCSGCKARFYCTYECQKSDWLAIHSVVCGMHHRLNELQTGASQSQHHV